MKAYIYTEEATALDDQLIQHHTFIDVPEAQIGVMFTKTNFGGFITTEVKSFEMQKPYGRNSGQEIEVDSQFVSLAKTHAVSTQTLLAKTSGILEQIENL